jgi:hypothetical protein
VKGSSTDRRSERGTDIFVSWSPRKSHGKEHDPDDKPAEEIAAMTMR